MAFSRIGFREPAASNLQEILRHIAAQQDEEVVNINTYGAETLVNWYTSHYEDDFTEKENGQIVFLGGDSSKSSATDTEEIEEADATDDDAWTFRMSDKGGGD